MPPLGPLPPAGTPGPAIPSGSSTGSSLAVFAEELDRATKAAASGLLDPKLTKLLFPTEVEGREGIALHGQLFSDAAWSTVGFFPAQVRVSDLGTLVAPESRPTAMAGLRHLQHAAFHYSIIECGIAQLVHRLDKGPLSQHELLGALANISRYTAAQFHDTQRAMKEFIAQVRVNKVEAPEAPMLPSSTPQVLAYDDKCRKMVDQLLKRVTAGARPAKAPAPGGGPAQHAKRARPDQAHSGRFFGRGGRGPTNQSAAPQGH